ncbi:MAG: bifunctional 5,10-methylenetetrahydrofolate dehydrogenase/5,10-methenyltetrahydrofolate cyclohydrolase, partial [Patescibacteria group bacterium]|nr:bifunctional 5,10-methylenetetrahydrofolate dehydrogenase/5,10-methenyltetrahydrofolate cyclohydrolase [Patescibacteria group bacterium]
KKISQERKDMLQSMFSQKKQTDGYRAPKLCVFVVGKDPSSQVYVSHKIKSCDQVGMQGEVCVFDEHISQQELLAAIQQKNRDSSVDAIIVQLPLPDHIDTQAVIQSVAVDKDVDGFVRNTKYTPATARGVMTLLESYNISLENKNIVVLGYGQTAGKPITQLLLDQGATVTSCNASTPDISVYTQQADILISAVGVPNLVTGDMVQEGVVVVDIGITRNSEGKLSGDIEFESVSKKASYITPVPGGVGPMTVSSLLENIVQAWER